MGKVLKLRSALKSGVRFQPATTRGMRSVSIRARSFDPRTRKFRFVLASETPCRTYRLDRNWNLVEVDEILPMSALRGLDAFKGCPLLDTHNSWSVRDVLGRITSLTIEGTELVGDAFLSDRDDVAGIARDLASGVLCEFSVGFDIELDGVVEEREGDVPLIRVRAWRVREGSLVPMPADSSAVMRSSASARSISQSRSAARPKGGRPIPKVLSNGARAMDAEEYEALIKEKIAAHRAESDARLDALETELISSFVEDDGDEDADLAAETEAAAEEARTAVLAAKRSKGKTPAPVVKPTERSAQEKATIAGLRLACGKRGLAADFKALEDAGATVDELRGVLAAGLRTAKTEIIAPVGQTAAEVTLVTAKTSRKSANAGK